MQIIIIMIGLLRSIIIIITTAKSLGTAWLFLSVPPLLTSHSQFLGN